MSGAFALVVSFDKVKLVPAATPHEAFKSGVPGRVPRSSLKMQYKSTARQRNASIGDLFERIGSYGIADPLTLFQ
jgi:hypothetical protein